MLRISPSSRAFRPIVLQHDQLAPCWPSPFCVDTNFGRGYHYLASGGAAVYGPADRPGAGVLPIKPSLPSRTRGCSRSCANCFSSRRLPPDVLKVISRSAFDLQAVLQYVGRISAPPVRGRQGIHILPRGRGLPMGCGISGQSPNTMNFYAARHFRSLHPAADRLRDASHSNKQRCKSPMSSPTRISPG